MTKIIIKPTTLFLFIFFFSFKSYGQYSKEFKTIMEVEHCKALVDTIKKCWSISQDSAFYKSKFITKKIFKEYFWFPCMRGIKRTDIEILFGKPNNTKFDELIYFTSKPTANSIIESFLSIKLNSNHLDSISMYNYSLQNKYITNNWKYNQKNNKKSTTLTPNKFGKREMPYYCLGNPEKHDVKRIFGKPNFIEFEYGTGFKSVNSINNNKTNIAYRYITKQNPLQGIDIYITNENEKNKIIAFNCNHSADTFLTLWKRGATNMQYNIKKMNSSAFEIFAICFFQMDSLNILKLFGEPTITYNNRWEYYFNEPLVKNSPPDRLIIYLDEKRKLLKLNLEYEAISIRQ